MLLYRMMKQSNNFEDSSIIDVAGNPPMTSLDIRSGEVLDAISTTNTGSFQGAVLEYEMSHGGDGGSAAPTITKEHINVITIYLKR